MKHNCLKNVPEFFCDECEELYFWPNTLHEHYYKEHVSIFLYHCQKCNQGFHWKFCLSGHKNACPNKADEDKYEGRAPWDEKLEEKFRRKKGIPVKIPVQVVQFAEEEFQHEQQGFDSAVGGLPSEQIAKPSATEPVAQQQIPSGSVTSVVSEDQMAIENIKPATYEPEPSTAENVLDMVSQGRLPNIGGDEEGDDDDGNLTYEVENKFDE